MLLRFPNRTGKKISEICVLRSLDLGEILT